MVDITETHTLLLIMAACLMVVLTSVAFYIAVMTFINGRIYTAISIMLLATLFSVFVNLSFN